MRPNTTWNGKRVALAAALITGLMLSWSPPSDAFELTGIGPRVGLINPEGTENTMTYGATLDFEKPGTRFHLVPNVMYWSEEDVSDLNPNFDVMYHFSPAGRIGPFAGAGLGAHFKESDESEFGANLFGGLMFPSSVATFTVEARAVVGGAEQFGIISGAMFNF